MAAINTQSVVPGPGTTPTYQAAAAGGDTFAADVRSFLHIKNGGGASITATLNTYGAAAGTGVVQKGITVPAGSQVMFGPLDPQAFGDVTLTGNIAYSAVTSVTVAVFRI